MIRMTQQHPLFRSRDRDHIYRDLQFLSPSILSIVMQYNGDNMAQDAESVGGFPPIASPDAPGSYSSCGNVHLKHEQSFCTTQASLEAITDVNPSINGTYLPTTIPPQAYDTRRSAATTVLSHDQDGPVDGTERDGSSSAPRQPGFKPHSKYDTYGSEALSQRLQNFQRGHPGGFDGYCPDTISKAAAESVSTRRQSLAYNVVNRSDRLSLYDPDVQTQPAEEWTSVGFCAPPQERPYQQPLHPTSCFTSASTEDQAQPPSTPYTVAASRLGTSYQNVQENDLAFPSTHGIPVYDPRSHTDAVPITTLSPCSSTLAMGNDAICIRREDTAPISDPDIDMDADMAYNPNLYDAEDVRRSRASTEPVGGKNDEPYAQLIYRAFMSRPNKSMTLQEIYQWFRENTDKAKSAGKGWQNSIRHNLSMNGAFTKRSANQPPLNSDGSLSLDASGADGRKSTEWFLESRYYGGVESTTRYRKGNSKSGGRNTRGDRAIDGNVKAVSGRKGGYQAAQNRKRTKAEQQQEAARQRNQRLQQYGPHLYAADEDGRFYPEYPAQIPANTSSPFQIQVSPSLNGHGGMLRSRQGHLDINYFQPRLPESAHDTRGQGLPGDVDPAAEPTTPPGPGHDSQMGELSYDNEYHPYMPGVLVRNDASYHHPAAVALSPTGYPPQPAYTLNQVEGVFDAPSGIDVPLFLNGKDLTAEEAAALMTANPWANEGPYCG